MTRGRLAWAGVAALLGACGLLGGLLPAASIDWQPALAAREPWRALSAVGVHYSPTHLAVNLVGVFVAALFGVVARVDTALAAAWLAAWPLTHLGLLVRPDLTHYGGLSGVLHAGVAVVVTGLLATGTRAQRAVAAALAAGLVAKLVSEAPWGAAVRPVDGWDIAVAPLAHTTGALAGVGCAVVALALTRHRPPRRSR